MGQLRNRLGGNATARQRQTELRTEFDNATCLVCPDGTSSLLEAFLRTGQLESVAMLVDTFVTAKFRSHLAGFVANVSLGFILLGGALHGGGNGYKQLRQQLGDGASDHTITNYQNLALALLGVVLGLYQAAFERVDILNLASLVAKLAQPTDLVSVSLHERLSSETRRLLGACTGEEDVQVKEALAADIDRILRKEEIYEPKAFAHLELTQMTRSLLSRRQSNEITLQKFNRALIEDAYPVEIARRKPVLERLRQSVDLRQQISLPACWSWLVEHQVRNYGRACLELGLVSPNHPTTKQLSYQFKRFLRDCSLAQKEEVRASLVRADPELATPRSSNDWISQGHQLYTGLGAAEKAALSSQAARLVAGWGIPALVKERAAETNADTSSVTDEQVDKTGSSVSFGPQQTLGWEQLVAELESLMPKLSGDEATRLGQMLRIMANRCPSQNNDAPRMESRAGNSEELLTK